MSARFGEDQLWSMLDGAVIGGLGGMVNYLREKSPRECGKFLVAFLTSAFAGMLTQLVGGWLNADVRLQFALAGIAGYLGVKLLDDVAGRMRRLVNGSLDALEKTVSSDIKKVEGKK